MTAKKAALLGRDAILGADDLEFEEVAVPEWGGTVRLAQLSGADIAAWQESLMGEGEVKGKEGLAVLSSLVARCAVDANGVRLFTDADAAALEGKNPKAIKRLFDVAARLNGVAADSDEQAEKN